MSRDFRGDLDKMMAEIKANFDEAKRKNTRDGVIALVFCGFCVLAMLTLLLLLAIK